MKAQEAINFILALAVAFLVAWMILKESVNVVLQHAQLVQQMVQAINDHEKRIKALEEKGK